MGNWIRGSNMVTYCKKWNGVTCEVAIDGEARFIAVEVMSFAGGWNLMTLDGKKQIKYFNTLAMLEIYIEEMDT